MKGNRRLGRPKVSSDGTGLVSRTGTLLLRELTQPSAWWVADRGSGADGPPLWAVGRTPTPTAQPSPTSSTDYSPTPASAPPSTPPADRASGSVVLELPVTESRELLAQCWPVPCLDRLDLPTKKLLRPGEVERVGDEVMPPDLGSFLGDDVTQPQRGADKDIERLLTRTVSRTDQEANPRRRRSQGPLARRR